MPRISARLSIDLPESSRLAYPAACAPVPTFPDAAAPGELLQSHPPGCSPYSFTQKHPHHGGVRPRGKNRQASVDAAIGAEVLVTYDEFDSYGQPSGADSCESESDSDNSPGHQVDWQFNTANPQRDRIQARYAAITALDEVRWVSGKAGISRAQAQVYTVPHPDDACSDHDRRVRSGRKLGVVQKLVTRLASQGPNKAGRSSKDKEDRGGDSGRGSSGTGGGRWHLRVSFFRGGCSGGGSEEEPMPVLRSRDSRIVHRIRLGLDGRPYPKGKLLSAGSGGGRHHRCDEDDEVTAAMGAAALAFAAAVSAPSATHPAGAVTCANVLAAAAAAAPATARAVRFADVNEVTSCTPRRVKFAGDNDGTGTGCAKTCVTAESGPSCSKHFISLEQLQSNMATSFLVADSGQCTQQGQQPSPAADVYRITAGPRASVNQARDIVDKSPSPVAEAYTEDEGTGARRVASRPMLVHTRSFRVRNC